MPEVGIEKRILTGNPVHPRAGQPPGHDPADVAHALLLSCTRPHYDQRVRRRDRLGFSVAGFGQNLVYNFVSIYMLVYLVEGVGLSRAGIVTATAILTAAKVYDAVVDLAIGITVDRTRSRWGRYRPYILVTALPVALLTVVLFSVPALPETQQLVWLGIGFLAFATAYTFGDVPYWAMTSAVPPDAANRTSLIAWARTAGALALAVVTLAGAPLARALSFGPVTTAAGYSRTAAVVGLVGMALFTLAFFTTRERVLPVTEPRPVVENLRSIGRNRALFLLLASGTLGFGRFVFQVGGALLALVVFGDETLFTLLGAALIVAMILATLATPALLRRTTRLRLMIGSTLATAVVYVAMWLVGTDNLMAVTAMVFLSGLLLGVFMVTQTAMIGDAADDGELRTGERDEGACFAALTFVSAVGGALATFAFGTVVAAVGYTKGVAVTSEMKAGVWAVATLLPAASVLLSLLPLIAYRVPEADMAELLDKRRAAMVNDEARAGTS